MESGLFIIGLVVLLIIYARGAEEMQSQHSKYGPINDVMTCPHCKQTGSIRTKEAMNKKGLSGAKATGAVLTGGLSILATGLSRKEKSTQAHCDHCNNTWLF